MAQRRPLGVSDGVGEGAATGHHVAPGEDAGLSGAHVGSHRHHVVLDPSRRGSDRSSERSDRCPSASTSESARNSSISPVGRGNPFSSRTIFSIMNTFAVGAVHGREPSQAHPFGGGVVDLLVVCRHAVAGPAVDDDGVGRPQPTGGAGRVHGRVAAAVDGHAAPEGGSGVLLDLAQERHGVEDVARVAGRDAGIAAPPGRRRPRRRRRSRRPPWSTRGRRSACRTRSRPRWPGCGRSPPERRLGGAGRRVCRSASSRPPGRPPRRRPRGGPVGAGDRRRPGPRARNRRPARCGRWPVPAAPACQPSLSARSPEEALDRVDAHGLVEGGTVTGRLARVEADAPHDGRERIVDHDLRHAASYAPASARRATLDVLARPDRRRCRGAGGPRRPAARPARSRCGWPGSSPRRA